MGREGREREREREKLASCQAASRKRAAEESAAGEPAKVARLESSKSQQSAVETPQKVLLDGNSPGAESPKSEREKGLKKGSSFETLAAVKKRLFETLRRQPSQQEKLGFGAAAKNFPIYYRLDYLWGRTPEKQAKPGLSPDTYNEREDRLQQEGLQQVEQQAKEVASSPGMAGAVVPVSRNKGGRPKGRKGKAKTQAGLKKKRADLTASQACSHRRSSQPSRKPGQQEAGSLGDDEAAQNKSEPGQQPL